MSKSVGRDKYWASDTSDSFVDEISSRIDRSYTYLRNSSYYNWMKKSWKLYNNIKGKIYNRDKGIQAAGEQGEYSLVGINNYRALIKSLLILVSGNSPTFKCSPSNDDSKSIDQSRLGEDIITYYVAEKAVEEVWQQVAEYALVLGEGYIKVAWDPNMGSEYDIETEEPAEAKEGEPAAENKQRIIYEGDLRFDAISPINIIYDRNIKEFRDIKWCFVRTMENKWNLAARFPDHRDEILSVTADEKDAAVVLRDFQTFLDGYNVAGTEEITDEIPVWEFFHVPTEAMPDGRYCKIVGNANLMDMPLPYCELPVKQMLAGKTLLTGYGYTPAFDLIVLQEILDCAFSTIVSQTKRDAVANWWVAGNDEIDVENLPGGGRLIRTKGQIAPQLIDTNVNLVQYYDLIKTSNQFSEMISGINAITRGNVDAKLSGTAYALLDSKSIQFASDIVRYYYKMVEDSATFSIRVIRDFATTKRVVAIVGQNHRGIAETSFTADDLKNFTRFRCSSQNPIFKTTGGKMEIAKDLLNTFGPTNGIMPQEYITLIETGQLDPIYDSAMSEITNTKRENEFLLRGKDVMASRYDNHPLHIAQHKKLTSDPIVRRNPQLLEKVTAHIIHHRMVWDFMTATEPGVLQALGITPSMTPNPNEPPLPGTTPDVASQPSANLTSQVRPAQQAPEIGVMPANLPESPVAPITGV